MAWSVLRPGARARRRLGRAALLVAAGWCSQAWAVDQATVERIRGEIVRYAQAKGETLDQFVDEVGSPLWHIESYLYGVEQGGGTVEEALDRLRQFVQALHDPIMRQALKCAGIRVPQDADPPPSPIDCAVLERRLGVR